MLEKFPVELGDKLYSPVRDTYYIVVYMFGKVGIINMKTGKPFSYINVNSSKLTIEQSKLLLADLLHDAYKIDLKIEEYSI